MAGYSSLSYKAGYKTSSPSAFGGNYLSANFLDANYLTGVTVTPPPPVILPSASTKTSSPSYKRPLRVKVVFYDLNDNEIASYDSFAALDSPLKLTYAQVTTANDSTGTFRLVLDDSVTKSLDVPNTFGLGNRVRIYAGKYQQFYQPLMTGLVRRVTPSRPNTNLLNYVISGYGTGIVLTERLINFTKQAVKSDILGTISGRDPALQMYKLINEIFTGENILPLGRPTIQESGKFTLSGINTRVKDSIRGFSQKYTSVKQVIDALCEMIGATLRIDANNNVRFDYARTIDSGITIRDVPTVDDLSLYTSYFGGNWEVDYSMEADQGFTNRLYAFLNTTSDSASSSSTDQSGSTQLGEFGIGQQFIPGASKFSNIALILSKVGHADSTQFGHVITDINNTPTGPVVASFNFPTSIVSDSAQPIFNLNMSSLTTAINPAGKYWIIMYKNGSKDNTLVWYNNNNTNTAGQYSARAEPGGRFDTNNVWTVSSTGPTYAFAAFSAATHISEASDPFSISRFGLVEQPIQLPWVTTREDLDEALFILLQNSAKPKATYIMQRCTAPDQLFEAGKSITIVDSLAGLPESLGTKAELQVVTHTFDAKSDDGGLGTRYVDLTPVGFLDLESQIQDDGL